MKMFKYWLKEGWDLFRFYRLRLLLSLASIAIGIGAVCALCSMNLIVAKNSEAILAKYGSSRFIATLTPMTPFEKKQVEQNLNVHNIGNWCWQHQNELTLVPYVVSTFKPDKVVVGTLSGIEKHLQWSIAEGRALHRLDEKSKVVVIGQGVAATLGSVLSLEGQYVEVVGILAPIEQNPLLEFDPNKSIFIGLEMLARLKAIPWVDSFIIQTDHTTLSDAQHTFKTKVRTWFGIKSMFIRDATFFAQVLHKQVNMTVKMLKMIALTTLLLGMLSIINLLVILIDERKKEIGLRLALGATPLVVFWQFLREITFLCSFGAVGGIVFGHLAAYIIVMQLGLTYYFGWFSWAVGLPVSMLMGIFVGIIPTLFAAQLHPVKLLNS